jgi:hypothetical protein
MRTTSSLLICLLVSSGCLWRTKRYAAPPVPDKTAPSVSYNSAPGGGLSRVVLDVAEGPALVESVDGGSVTGHGVVGTGAAAFAGSVEYSTRVCVTPCVVDTKPGTHELKFTLVNDPARTSRGFINVDQDTSIYRHSIGRQHSSRRKGLVGAPLVIGGLAAAVYGLGTARPSYYNSQTGMHEAQWNTGAVVLMGAGVAITALGAWLIYGSVVEEQPGSGVQWHPQDLQPVATP